MAITDRARLRTGANVVGVLVLVVVVAAFAVYGFPQLVGADHSYVVLSGSMEPAMSPGDAVVVDDAAPGGITEGDIITFRTGSDTPTTHRVIDVVERGGSVAYVTKGDANEDPDAGTVPHEQVIGEVVFVIPLIGYAVRFLNTPLGFVVAVVIPLGVLVGSDLWAIVRSVGDGAGAGGDDGVDSTVDAVSASDSVSDGDASKGGGETTAEAEPAVVATDPTTEQATEAATEQAIDPTTGQATEAATEQATEAATDPTTEPAAEKTGTAVVETDDAESQSDATLTLTRSSIQVIAFVLGGYVPYTAYVAYALTSAWAITVAIATGIAFLFVLALYARSATDATGAEDDPAAGDAADAGDASSAVTDGGDPVVVPSLAPTDDETGPEPTASAATAPGAGSTPGESASGPTEAGGGVGDR